VVVVLLAGLCAGCASRGAVRQLQQDLAATRADVATLRSAHERLARESAHAGSRLETLDARLNRLGGTLNAAAASAGELGTRLTDAERALQALAALEDARRAAPPPAPPPPPPAPPPAREPAPPRTGGPEAQYAAALATFRSHEHGQAILEFLDFLARYPKHSLAANAQFWIGEAYYAERDWRQALTEFEKVIDQVPASAKTADALLKIGLCYRNLREPARARQVWQQLLREHPDSEAAGHARRLLAPPRTPPVKSPDPARKKSS
jgi:tol-pal system protein YbgF